MRMSQKKKEKEEVIFMHRLRIKSQHMLEKRKLLSEPKTLGFHSCLEMSLPCKPRDP